MRSSGVLLHPTSLPGAYGIGELGSEAFAFVGFLEDAGQGLWQTLPLNPTDSGGSPYSSPSAFAGNPLLASTERLAEEGLIEEPPPDGGPVNFASVAPRKMERLRMAYSRWKPGEKFDEFREGSRFWLDDFALFTAIKEKLGKPWNEWPEELAARRPDALEKARRELEADILFHMFAQFRFFEDWRRVKKAANEAGVSIIGDIPIFVSHDSADVWSNRELFFLDGNDGSPSVVAGVPPDYFSETGQLWGNPLYDWERMRDDGYSWWKSRMKHALSLCDALRLDHFRGFEAYWEVPADDGTATCGRWVEGPGRKLFDSLRSSLGELPLIAEDLGDISPEVVKLREDLGFPGMKVLQFGFSHPGNHFLPHNYEGGNWVAYTGTHDNDTTAGWWRDANGKERSLARRYLGKEYIGAEDFIRLAYSSTAKWAVIPMQDLLGLGSTARMNTPGTSEGNWRWRMGRKASSSELAARMRGMAEVYGRVENT